jgi:hypothetical protein
LEEEDEVMSIPEIDFCRSFEDAKTLEPGEEGPKE